MNLVVVNAPSVISCKTQTRGWINLTHVRQLVHIYHQKTLILLVIWSNGDRQVFRGEDAVAIIRSWENANKMKG
ncbi:hypothetical protein [Fischerella sp. PCC 9605]|uniref:hypothetical protein n=1 Tax=Fischerella sp. PCC 9605 TaxID=1173024 RepID=UPI00047DE5BF|nr:hypothetical protein [Fischerella sp. PCC 9605]